MGDEERGDEGALKVRIGRERAERVWVRRRRSLWLAGGCSRGAGATPGGDATTTPSPEGMSHRREIPSGQRIPTPSLPGVGGAPRHQPPANHRERLRRTRERAPRDHLGYVGIRNRTAVLSTSEPPLSPRRLTPTWGLTKSNALRAFGHAGTPRHYHPRPSSLVPVPRPS